MPTVLVLSQYVEETYARDLPAGGAQPARAEVLKQVAQGRSNAAIADRLVVTHGAVEKHVSNIFAKLDLAATAEDHRRVLAVLAWLRG